MPIDPSHLPEFLEGKESVEIRSYEEHVAFDKADSAEEFFELIDRDPEDDKHYNPD